MSGHLCSRSESCPALQPSQFWQPAFLVPLASSLATMLWVPPAGPQGGRGRERREAGDSGQRPTRYPSAHPHVMFRQHMLACHRLPRKVGRDADESSVLKVLILKTFCSVFAGRLAGLTFLSLTFFEIHRAKAGEARSRQNLPPALGQKASSRCPKTRSLASCLLL